MLYHAKHRYMLGFLSALLVSTTYSAPKKAPIKGPVKEIENKAQLDQLVKKQQLVLCEFYSPSCPVCKMTFKPFRDLASQYNKKVSFAQVNADKYSELAKEHDISGVPHFVLFKDGKKVLQETGFSDKSGIEEMINPDVKKKRIEAAKAKNQNNK